MAALTQFLDLLAPLAFPLVLLTLAVLVAWLVRYHPVGAVVRNTVAQAIRVRAAFAIMAVYLVLVPVLPFVVKGDGTLRGQLHVVINYSLIAAGLLLGVLTLAMSTTTLWSEIHEKQVYLLESKPLRRWQLLVGKLLGILSINAGLLAFMALVTWTCVTVLARTGDWNDAERALARMQILTARRVVDPVPFDPGPMIDQNYATFRQRLVDRGMKLEGKTEADVRKIIRRELILAYNAVRPLDVRYWRFDGLKHAQRRRGTITVRLKFACSDDRIEGNLRTGWEIGDPESLNFFRRRLSFKPDEVHEVELHSRLITPDGVLHVRLHNIDRRLVALIFSGKAAIQVLVPVAGFASNLARGLWLVFIEVLFLAVLGLFCSTFLSFPVSPVVALALYVLIFLAAAIQGEIDQKHDLFENREKRATIAALETGVRATVRGLRFLLPPFDEYGASERVSSGEEIPWLFLLKATVAIAVLRGGILMLIGAAIFQRRELALATR